MTEGENDQQPRGMYSRAFRRAEAEARHPAPPAAPPVETPRIEAVSIEAVPIDNVPPRPSRRMVRPRRDRMASRPLEPRALIAVAAVLVAAAVLAPLAIGGGSADADLSVAAAAEESAPVGDIELRAPAASSLAAATGALPVAARSASEGSALRSRSVDGGLVVESRPAGARVTVNGIGWGETPLRIRYIPFGTKRVRIVKEGYVSAERTVRIDAYTPRPRLQIALRAQK